MADVVVIVVCFALAEIVRAVPSIIWSIRCPADSPNYTLPPLTSRYDNQ